VRRTPPAHAQLNQNYAPTHVVLAIFNNGQSRCDGASGEALLAISWCGRAARGATGRAYLGLASG
jgi:hypothetical protein